MVVEDVLATRLELIGAREYVHGFSRIVGAFGAVRHELSELERAELSAGLATGALGLTLVGALAEAVKMAGEAQQIMLRTSHAFEQMGQRVPEERLEEFGNLVQDTTSVARDQAIELEGLFAAYGIGEEQAKKLTVATLNAAEALKARGLSAVSVAARIGTAFERYKQGDIAGFQTLSRMGIVINRARAAADPLGATIDALNQKGGNLAAEMRHTLPGAIDAFRNSLTRLGQDIGKDFLPALTKLVEVATDLIDKIDKIPGGPQLVGGAALTFGVASLMRAGKTIIPLLAGGATLLRGAAASATGAAAEEAVVTTGGAIVGAKLAGFGKPIVPPAAAPPAAGGGLMGRLGLLGAGLSQGIANEQMLKGFFGVNASKLPKWLQALITPQTLLRGLGGAEGGGEHTEAVKENTKKLEDLHGAITAMSKQLGSEPGLKGVRDVLGDARVVAAFARGIA